VALTVLILLVGLELKHYAADYLLQPRWVLRGKGSLTAPGGYVHAGIHAVGTAIVLAVLWVPVVVILMICAAEFVVHYAIDYAKYRYGSGVEAHASPWRFWALHGLDQLAHQLTYAGIVFGVLLGA
jgi:hypothetical protein